MTFWGLAQTERKCVIKNRPTRGNTHMNAHTHTHTDTDTKHFVLSRILYGFFPPCHPLTRVFALFITSTLAPHPLFLWVTLTRAWGAGKEEEVVEEEEEDTPRNDQWVCPPRQTAASAPSAFLTAGQEFVRDFSSYFDCLSPGKYYITCLFDWSDAYSHSPVSWPLFWAWNHFHPAHVWWGSEICIRCCLCCCVVAHSEQRSRCYPTLTWVSRVEGMQGNIEKHTHTLIHTALIGSQKRWS